MIAVGLFVSAWVAANRAATIAPRWFKGRPLVTIVIASGIGAVTPVCGITVLPLTAGFLCIRHSACTHHGILAFLAYYWSHNAHCDVGGPRC